MTTNNVSFARPYAIAVFELAKQQRELDQWSQTLMLLSAVVRDDLMAALIQNPGVDKDTTVRGILDICSGKLNEVAQNLVRLLAYYKRLLLLPDIAKLYDELRLLDGNVVKAGLVSAVELTSAEKGLVVQKLEKRLQKKVEATVRIDPTLIGGMKVIVGDSIIDVSVRAGLQKLAHTLKA